MCNNTVLKHAQYPQQNFYMLKNVKKSEGSILNIANFFNI